MQVKLEKLEIIEIMLAVGILFTTPCLIKLKNAVIWDLLITYDTHKIRGVDSSQGQGYFVSLV
jgi:hypothetical protein